MITDLVQANQHLQMGSPQVFTAWAAYANVPQTALHLTAPMQPHLLLVEEVKPVSLQSCHVDHVTGDRSCVCCWVAQHHAVNTHNHPGVLLAVKLLKIFRHKPAYLSVHTLSMLATFAGLQLV